jgi:HD superfamily phosphohydrolase YqeK
LLPPQFSHLIASDNPVADVRRFLRAAGRLDTLRHVTQVALVGLRLARRFDIAEAPVQLACLAHDLAAVVPLHDIIAAAEALGVPLTGDDYAIPQVVHGLVGSAVLAQALHIHDQSVLDAVAFHTTLRPGAAPLEQLVFVADKLAFDPTTPATAYHAALSAAQATASLPELCWIYLSWVVREGPRLGWRLHPNLVAAKAALRPTRARP